MREGVGAVGIYTTSVRQAKHKAKATTTRSLPSVRDFQPLHFPQDSPKPRSSVKPILSSRVPLRTQTYNPFSRRHALVANPVAPLIRSPRHVHHELNLSRSPALQECDYTAGVVGIDHERIQLVRKRRRLGIDLATDIEKIDRISVMKADHRTT